MRGEREGEQRVPKLLLHVKKERKEEEKK